MAGSDRLDMTKKPNRVRVLMMPYQDDDDRDSVGYSGPATVLTGLPRTIRRHELRLVVPLADSTIYEMEKRGDFPRRFNLTPRCVVWDLEEIETWLEQRRRTYLEGRAKIAPGPDVHQRKTRPVPFAISVRHESTTLFGSLRDHRLQPTGRGLPHPSVRRRPGCGRHCSRSRPSNILMSPNQPAEPARPTLPNEASEHAVPTSLPLEFVSHSRYMTTYMVRSMT